MTLGGDMLNNQSSGVTRAARVEFRQRNYAQPRPGQRENDFMERPLHLADRSRLQRGHRSIENDEVSRQTFALPVETARLKVRDIIDGAPQRGYLEIVEGWRQRPDGLIEFAICRLACRTE